MFFFEKGPHLGCVKICSLRALLRIDKTFLYNLHLYKNYAYIHHDIEKVGGICPPTLIVDEFLGLFLHPSIFSNKHSRST